MDADRRLSWGFSIFCDDFRAEIGGKLSLMGVYQQDFIFQGAFPHVAQKLAILILYYELANAISEDFEFRIFLPGDETEKPTFRLVMDRKSLVSAPVASTVEGDSNDGERLVHSRVPVVFAPLVIPKEGRIKVRAHYSGGQILKLGSLAVRPASPEETKALFGISPTLPSS